MASLNLDISPQYALISEPEYYALEEKAVIRHEYFGGEIFAMAGASPAHAQLTANVMGSLVGRLRGRACYATSSDQRVKVEATGLITYPDLAVVCPPERYDPNNAHTLLNPRVVVEILSPSTAQYDRTTKFENYQQIESLSDYILVEQDQMRIEHYHRTADGTWQRQIHVSPDEELNLTDLDVVAPLSEIYERLNLPTGSL